MFKSTKKRDKHQNNFELELDQQLNSIKQDNYCVVPLGNRNQQIVNIIDEAVNELKGQAECSNDSLKHYKSKNEKSQYNIREREQLQIEKQSTIDFRFKEQLEMRSSQQVKPFISNPIWNLCTNQQIIGILQANFDSYFQQQPIQTEDFIQKMVLYFIGLTVGDEELDQIKKIVAHQITTTSIDVVSLNALQILAKKVKLQHYFIQILIEAKIHIKIKELNRQNKTITQEVNQKAEKIALKQRNLKQRLDEIIKKETHLYAKEKTIGLKQKDLLQREQIFKRTIEDKCFKLLEDYSTKMSDKVKEVEKTSAQLERNIKYKIQILERRAETLRTIKNQQLDVRNKKLAGEGEAKIKLRKMQKELQNIQTKHRIEREQCESEEKDFIKTISLLQDKLNKHEKKNHKMQDKITELEQQLSSLKQKQEQLILQNTELAQKANHNQRPLLQLQQLHQPLTSKTNRSQKCKKKTKGRYLQSIIPLYEYVLQLNYAANAYIKKQIQLKIEQQIMGSVPLIISLLCTNETEGNPSSEPHYLVINICRAMLGQYYENSNYRKDYILQNIEKESRNKQVDKNKIQSKQIAELIQMPLKAISKISILLLLLPILDWKQLAATFLQQSFKQIVHLIENHFELDSNDLLVSQIQLLSSKESISFLIDQFIVPFPSLTLESHDANEEAFKNKINSSIIVVDFMITLSNQWGIQNGGSLSSIHCQSVILTTFMDLTQCIFGIYSNQKKSCATNKQLLFKYLQQIEQLTEKLSILLQRVLYQSKKRQFSQSQSKQLHKLYGALCELNKSNGQRHALIIANLKSILAMISQQF